MKENFISTLHMNKTLNIVVYKPGYAGNLLRFILSMESNTFPIFPENIPLSENERLKHYTFKNLFYHNKSWASFHDKFSCDRNLRLDAFLKQNDFDTFTVIAHPGYFTNYPQWFTSFVELERTSLENFKKINYIAITLNSEYEYIIEDFKNWNGGLLKREPDHDAFEKYLIEYDPIIVKLENFFYDKDVYLQEVKNLYNKVNLEITKEEDLIALHKDWKNSRRLFKYNL